MLHYYYFFTVQESTEHGRFRNDWVLSGIRCSKSGGSPGWYFALNKSVHTPVRQQLSDKSLPPLHRSPLRSSCWRTGFSPTEKYQVWVMMMYLIDRRIHSDPPTFHVGQGFWGGHVIVLDVGVVHLTQIGWVRLPRVIGTLWLSEILPEWIDSWDGCTSSQTSEVFLSNTDGTTTMWVTLANPKWFFPKFSC